MPPEKLGFEDLPTIGKISVTSPGMITGFGYLNEGKKYPDQIKPFNFLLTCHVQSFGHPNNTDPTRFHLIAPYEPNPRKWLNIDWTDQYSGKRFRITTTGNHGSRNTARVRTYGEVVEEYAFHPESKCADSAGNICEKRTAGLLQRRHIGIDGINHIGKESNSMEEVDAEMVHSEENVYTTYVDPRGDEWEMKIRPVLKSAPLGLLIEKTGFSKPTLMDWRAGRSRPHPKNLERLLTVLKEMG